MVWDESIYLFLWSSKRSRLLFSPCSTCIPHRCTDYNCIEKRDLYYMWEIFLLLLRTRNKLSLWSIFLRTWTEIKGLYRWLRKEGVAICRKIRAGIHEVELIVPFGAVPFFSPPPQSFIQCFLVERCTCPLQVSSVKKQYRHVFTIFSPLVTSDFTSVS